MPSALRKLLLPGVLITLLLPGTARADDIWDLITLSGTSGYMGSSWAFTNGALGSITAYSTNAYYAIYGKNDGGVLGTEWGLGLCAKYRTYSTTCSTSKSQYDHEIGDWQNAGIVLNLSGLAADVNLLGFTLASAQAGETWKVYYTNSGSCNGSTDFSGASFFSASSPNRGSDYYDQAVTGFNCLYFAPVWSQESYQVCKSYNQVFQEGYGSGTGWYKINNVWKHGKYANGDCTEWKTKYKDPAPDGNYLLQSITTETLGGGTPEEVVPEPGTMSLIATGLAGIAAARKRRKKQG
jgi:hypothetical protein